MEIYTVNHHERDEADEAELRLDASVELLTGKVERMNDNEDYDRENWFSAYVPEDEDG